MDRISNEDFIRIWQASGSVTEVMKAAGYDRPLQAASRAGYMRKKGIPLKKMPRTGGGAKIEYSNLASLAKELAPKE